MKYWGESSELMPVKELSIGDIVLCKINRNHYSKGYIKSLESSHQNIFGEEVRGILVSIPGVRPSIFYDNRDEYIKIAESHELRHNQETMKENRDRKIREVFN